MLNTCRLANNTSVWWATHIPCDGEVFKHLVTNRMVWRELQKYATGGPLMCSTSAASAVHCMGIDQMKLKSDQEDAASGGAAASGGGGAAAAAGRCIVLVQITSSSDLLRCLPMYLTGFEASKRRAIALWNCLIFDDDDERADAVEGVVNANGIDWPVYMMRVVASFNRSGTGS